MKYTTARLSKMVLCLTLSFAACRILAQAQGGNLTTMGFPQPRHFAQTRLYKSLRLPMYLTMQNPNSEEHKNGRGCGLLACYISGGRPYVFLAVANLGAKPDKFKAIRFEVFDLCGKLVDTLDCQMNVDFPASEINNYNMHWDVLSRLGPGQYKIRTTINPAEHSADSGIETSCEYGFTVWSRDRKAPKIDYSRYQMPSKDLVNAISSKYGRGALGSLVMYNEFRNLNLNNPPPPTEELPLDLETYDLDWNAMFQMYSRANSGCGEEDEKEEGDEDEDKEDYSAERSVTRTAQSGNPRGSQFVDTNRLWREAADEAKMKFPDVGRPGSNADAANYMRRMQERFRIFTEKFDREAPPEQKAAVTRNLQLFMANGGVQQWKQQRSQNSRLFCSRTGSDGAPHGYYTAGLGCPKCKGEVNYTPRYRGSGVNTIVAPPATGHASGNINNLLIQANQSN